MYSKPKTTLISRSGLTCVPNSGAAEYFGDQSAVCTGEFFGQREKDTSDASPLDVFWVAGHKTAASRRFTMAPDDNFSGGTRSVRRAGRIRFTFQRFSLSLI
jgi:hypothetical protein